MTVREQTEQIEEQTLSKFAFLSKNSKGRAKQIEPCPIRTCFARDRDRIIHCRAFRRLKHKTQVFLSPTGDHYRTRLTHTLEVAQIARTICVALRLNESLTEAISLGHDLGHTPFGHAGERALNDCIGGGFSHFEQSVRVCEKLENDGEGLNLSFEVIDGILHHTKGQLPMTLEGQIVRLSDRIAYVNHDIDDAIRGGVITEDSLPRDSILTLGKTKSERINTLVTDVIKNSQNGVIKMSDAVKNAFDNLHEFMFGEVYSNPIKNNEEKKACKMLTLLFSHFKNNPIEMPNEYLKIVYNEGPERAACDYIAGMTDSFAISKFEEIFVPSNWSD